MIKVYFLAVFLVTACMPAQTMFQKILPGEYPVTFNSYHAYDSSRPAVAEQEEKRNGRLLQINVWYPAVSEKGTKLNFNDYVRLIASEKNANGGDVKGALRTFYDWTLDNAKTAPQVTQFKITGTETMASFGQQRAPGPFPVVLAMHGGAADVAVMAEFLASHGYIVVNTPSKGYLRDDIDVNVLGLETQMRDYEFALNWLIHEERIQSSGNISLVGVSFGGQSALSYSFTNDVSAVVSLDGGIGSVFGASLVREYRKEGDIRPGVPLLHLYNPRDLYTDLTFLRNYKDCQRTLIGMKDMEHAHFWSWGILDRYMPGVIGNIRPGDSYEAVLQQTLDFISMNSGRKVEDCDWCGTYQYDTEYLAAG